MLRGSPWEITDPNGQIVRDMVERSFAPIVHDGFCMDLVSGRAIGRLRLAGRCEGRGQFYLCCFKTFTTKLK